MPRPPTSLFLICILCILFTAGCTGNAGPEKTTAVPSLLTPMIPSQPASVVTPVPVQPALTDSVTTIPSVFLAVGNNTHHVAKGDRYNVTGIVKGEPVPRYIYIWIFGERYIHSQLEAVDADGSFSYEIRQETTRVLDNGTHLIIIQLPGTNGFQTQPETESVPGTFATYLDDIGMISIRNNNATRKEWQTIACSNRKSCHAGYPASVDLLTALNDPETGDDYTTSLLLVEEPWIRVDPVTIKRGENFTITGTTNLAAGDELLVQVYPKWYVPMQCGCGALSPYLQMMLDKSGGATGNIKVSKGSGRINTWAFDGKGETLGPDEFRLRVDAVIQSADNVTDFRVADQ
jgi:trimeric autotransporter adhesin